MKKIITSSLLLIWLISLAWCWQQINYSKITKMWSINENTAKSTLKTLKWNYWCNWNYCYIKVTDKWIKRYHNKDLYLIYSNIWTYKISDSLLYLQFRSSDMYWFMEKWKCYVVKTHILSFRIPFLSSYKDIVWVMKTNCKK